MIHPHLVLLVHACVVLTTAGSGTNPQDELIGRGVAHYAAKEFSAAKADWTKAALDLVGPSSSKAHVYLGSLAQEVRTARRCYVRPVSS